VTLIEILHPVSVADFLTEYFNAAPLHVAGPAARFAALTAARSESSRAVAALAHNLELDLEAPIRAVPRPDWQGLPLHRGERDVMVLQSAGADLWHVHGRNVEPSAESMWQAEIREGGALYIPRGWWYSAEPRRAPSQSLTLHIENPTGADLLFWLAEKMKRHEAFDADIPRFAGPAVKSEYLVAMRHAMVQAFRNRGLLERYCQRLNHRAPVAATPETPWSQAESLDGYIALTAHRRPRIMRRDKETIYIRVGGLDFPFPLDAAPLLTFLFDRAPVSTAAFYSEFGAEFDRDEISEFLAVLHQAAIIGPADGDSADADSAAR
jgi:Cupin superfamily protein